MKKYIVEWTERFYVAVIAKDKMEAEMKAFEPYNYDHAQSPENHGIENLEIIEIKDDL